jgi:hypothetical protein
VGILRSSGPSYPHSHGPRSAKSEDTAWAQVGAYYDAHQTSVLAALAARARDKGKARADVRPGDLPVQHLGDGGLALAQRVVAEHAARLADPGYDRLDVRLAELDYKVHASSHMRRAAH